MRDRLKETRFQASQSLAHTLGTRQKSGYHPASSDLRPSLRKKGRKRERGGDMGRLDAI